jgi:hypothetical protein
MIYGSLSHKTWVVPENILTLDSRANFWNMKILWHQECHYVARLVLAAWHIWHQMYQMDGPLLMYLYSMCFFSTNIIG